MKSAKAIAALVGFVVMFIAAKWTDGTITTEEWIQVVMQATTAVGVYLAANVPTLTWAKFAVAGVLAVANLLTSYVSGGLSGPEILDLVIAGLTAAGVWAVPNVGAPEYAVVGATGGSYDPRVP